jgi:hypothetical protein
MSAQQQVNHQLRHLENTWSSHIRVERRLCHVKDIIFFQSCRQLTTFSPVIEEEDIESMRRWTTIGRFVFLSVQTVKKSLTSSTPIVVTCSNYFHHGWLMYWTVDHFAGIPQNQIIFTITALRMFSVPIIAVSLVKRWFKIISVASTAAAVPSGLYCRRI